jgi:RNA polymerase sigma-70 factor, ECF subfamily
LIERFLAAAEDGNLKALEELLAEDAVLYADSGGKAMAPPEPLFDAALIARLMAGVARRALGEFETRLVKGTPTACLSQRRALLRHPR